MDLIRQMVAALLTLSMFVMIGNMIKRDHFDSLEVNIEATSNIQYEAIKVSKQSLVTINHGLTKGPWDEYGAALKPCWNKPSPPKDTNLSKGFIIFSLTDGPEYHLSQIVDAVVVARYLGATLVLPDIRGTKPKGKKRNFGRIYNVDKFVKSLDGIVRIAKDRPPEASIRKFATVRVPNGVSEGYLANKIKPLFKKEGNLRLSTYFPSSTLIKEDEEAHEHLDSLSCLAMFGTLELQPGLQQVIDLMIDRLRELSQESNGRFVAADLRVEKLEQECQESGGSGRKWCCNAKETGDFLKQVGFNEDTTIYLTQPGWHSILDPLRHIFPKTCTKEAIMPMVPADKKPKFLSSNISEFSKVIDFHICSQSDVFVPSMPGLFYRNVVGKRIASGKNQILVPAKRISSAASAYISPYISKKSHLAYSCFC